MVQQDWSGPVGGGGCGVVARKEHFYASSGLTPEEVEAGLKEIRARARSPEGRNLRSCMPGRDEDGRFKPACPVKRPEPSKAELVRTYYNKARLLEWLAICTGKQVALFCQLRPTKVGKASHEQKVRQERRLGVLNDVLIDLASAGVAVPGATRIAREMARVLGEPVSRDMLYQLPYRALWMNVETGLPTGRTGNDRSFLTKEEERTVGRIASWSVEALKRRIKQADKEIAEREAIVRSPDWSGAPERKRPSIIRCSSYRDAPLAPQRVSMSFAMPLRARVVHYEHTAVSSVQRTVFCRARLAA